MKKIQVDYLYDDTMAKDVRMTTGRVNVKIHLDGRGYLKIDGETLLYRHVERIQVTDSDESVAMDTTT